MKPDIDPNSPEMKELEEIYEFLKKYYIYTQKFIEYNPRAEGGIYAGLVAVIVFLGLPLVTSGEVSWLALMLIGFFFLLSVIIKVRFTAIKKNKGGLVKEKINILHEKYNCGFQFDYSSSYIFHLQTKKRLHLHNGYFTKYHT